VVEVEPLIHIYLSVRRTMIPCTCNSVKKIMPTSYIDKTQSHSKTRPGFGAHQHNVHSIKFSVFTVDFCLIESVVIAWPLRIPNKVIKQC